MNTSFNVLDKKNNVQKTADVIVKFNYENKEYLIYSIDENDQNKQIFISRLISNLEGEYFIENILPEEKGKLSNIVYNIVIVLPSYYQKGKDAKELIDEFSTKNLVNLSKDIPELKNQEYYNSCSVAITSNVLVNNAISFYLEHLVGEESSPSKDIPTWTIPTEESSQTITPTTPNIDTNQNLNHANAISDLNITTDNSLNSMVDQNINLEPNSISEVSNDMLNTAQNFSSEENLPNPQAEILTAVNNDPNLSKATGIRTEVTMQPNLGKAKKAGFANSKYIIIGTVSLLLAIVVVIVAYILIKNK